MRKYFIDKGINSQAAGLIHANDEDIRHMAVGSYIQEGSFAPHKKRAADATMFSGAVFLPAAGNRNGTTVNNAGSNGNYWSSSPNTSNVNNAYNVNFNSGNLNPANNNNRNNGNSVRLVRAAESTYILAR